MNEARSGSKVKDIVMTYQQYHRSTSNPIPDRTGPSTQFRAVHRKTSQTYSPLPNTPTSTYRSATQPAMVTPSLSTTTAPTTSSSHVPPTPNSLLRAPSLQPAATLDTTIPTQSQIDAALQKCLHVLTDATTYHSKRPFSALLLAPDATTVLQTHSSISHVQHAESELARLAFLQYPASYLSKCTLVSTWEPCAMCAGTIYWSGISRLVYAASEVKLKEITGDSDEDSLTMNLPCRQVLEAGRRRITVIGPVRQWEDKVVDVCTKWWQEHRAQNLGSSSARTASLPQNRFDGTAVMNKRNSYLVLHTEDEQIDSSITEEGEYKADLKVDWF